MSKQCKHCDRLPAGEHYIDCPLHWMQQDQTHDPHPCPTCKSYREKLEEAEKELVNLRRSRDLGIRDEIDIQQTLGKALGYPWFKDDQKNFPRATDDDGVCVGDHVAASLAAEAARKLEEANKRIEELELLVRSQQDIIDGKVTPHEDLRSELGMGPK